MFLQKSSVLPFVLALVASPLPAGTVDFRTETALRAAACESRFQQWHLEPSLASGAFYSPIRANIFSQPRRPSFDYTETEIRAGIMLNSPYDAGFFRGNFEFLLGLGGGAIFEGPGNALGVGDMFIRYNFIRQRSRIVPYLQLGAGLVFSDAARDHPQRIIGRTQEFGLQAGFGCRFLLNEEWSFDVEWVYQHISNADTADRNVGVNALGGVVALTRSL
ncbi:MAG: acyloxyacyl hydrolase [Chthoniobacterales bacterium]|nr:acyloxyacyl hydrolase [Chthoniobacterales bacterium]